MFCAVFTGYSSWSKMLFPLLHRRGTWMVSWNTGPWYWACVKLLCKRMIYSFFFSSNKGEKGEREYEICSDSTWLDIWIYANSLTQRQLYVFMALLGVSRLRVSADPQVLNDRLKLLAVKLRVVPWKRKVVSVLTQLYLSRGYWAPFLLGDTAISCANSLVVFLASQGSKQNCSVCSSCSFCRYVIAVVVVLVFLPFFFFFFINLSCHCGPLLPFLFVLPLSSPSSFFICLAIVVPFFLFYLSCHCGPLLPFLFVLPLWSPSSFFICLAVAAVHAASDALDKHFAKLPC